jgi:hypothetical protein
LIRDPYLTGYQNVGGIKVERENERMGWDCHASIKQNKESNLSGGILIQTLMYRSFLKGVKTLWCVQLYYPAVS